MVVARLGWPGACALSMVVACGGAGSAGIGPGSDGGGDGSSSESGAPGKDGGADSQPSGDSGAVDSASKDGPVGDVGAGDTGAADTGAADGGKEGGVGDGGPTAPGTYCGPSLVCTGASPQQGTLCCVNQNGNPPPYGCAAAECGCDTQLACSSDANCKTGSSCCIASRQDATCGSGHFVSACQTTPCSNNQQHLCDPNSVPDQCSAGQGCNVDTGGVNLPIAGFGVCN